MAKKRTKQKAKVSKAVEPDFQTMLHGLMHYAELEWQEFSGAATPTSLNPKSSFFSGYLVGVAFGLALSPRSPDMVQKMLTHYRDNRGWDV